MTGTKHHLQPGKTQWEVPFGKRVRVVRVLLKACIIGDPETADPGTQEGKPGPTVF